MGTEIHILGSLLAFGSYFFIGIAMVLFFLFVYTHITPHDEWRLIKENNIAASLAFSGSLLGYIIPLSSAAINSVSIPDYLIWGFIALVVQLMVYGGVRLYMPNLSDKIINGNTAAGVFMGAAALAGGIFNAACMTW
ncbi:putative membrane protein [Kosakonia oryzendophytica]|uniref:Putative membrane protein n=1 Tax=Kosakonia oryzendophytica TaxID=1005665 RepID=A0A1C3ZVK7_9ENTR|nr:putative membrane protein [Enterobacter sp. AG5470]SCB86444.1 putative membrane protein [Kosakonia oryzendophytica]